MAITAVLVVVVLVGVSAMYYGFRTRKRAQRLATLDVVSPNAVADGTVGVTGVARAGAASVDSPLADREVIGYTTRTTVTETRYVEDEDDSGVHSDNRETTTRRHTSTEVAPFVVEGKGVSVAIEATSDVELELAGSESITETNESPDHSMVLERERRKRVSELEDGDEVTVFGHARTDAGGDPTVGPDAELGDLLVTTRRRDELVEQYGSNAPIAMALGAAVSVASLALLAYEYVVA